MDLCVSLDSATDNFEMTDITSFRGIVWADYTVKTTLKGVHSGSGGGIVY